jgi:hypothetical protein
LLRLDSPGGEPRPDSAISGFGGATIEYEYEYRFAECEYGGAAEYEYGGAKEYANRQLSSLPTAA